MIKWNGSGISKRIAMIPWNGLGIPKRIRRAQSSPMSCAFAQTSRLCKDARKGFFIFLNFFFNLKIRRALLAKELLKMDSDKLTSPTYPSIRITEYNGVQGSVTMSCSYIIIRPEGLGNNIRDTAVPGVDEGQQLH